MEQELGSVTFRTIGWVEVADDETVARDRFPDIESRIVLDPGLTGGLEGLRPGQRIMVLFHFHRTQGYELRQHPRGDKSRPPLRMRVLVGKYFDRSTYKSGFLPLHDLPIISQVVRRPPEARRARGAPGGRFVVRRKREESIMAGKQHQRLGPGGVCVCPKCGTRVPHQKGTPCQDERCPECGAKMLREGSLHHRLWQEKQERAKRKKKGGVEVARDLAPGEPDVPAGQ